MNFPSIDIHSHRNQLVASAVAASVATGAVITAYHAYSRRNRRRDLNAEVLKSIQTKGSNFNFQKQKPETVVEETEPEEIALKPRGGKFDENLIREQLARNYAFFGEEGMEKVRGGSVAVIGCGGVGSWAAVMLVRSGVSKIRLVDFDYVTLSSLNRHATATVSDVGMPKAHSMERALKQMARWVEVDARVEIWRKEEGGLLLDGVDWVIDAIDNISTKVDLLKYCHDHNIKVFSSMGAGAKSDPTRIQISDISYTIYDPLARSVRRRLRLQGVTSGIPVVYSTEVPSDVKLLPLPEEEFQKGQVKELGVFDDFRVRILPVLGPLPAIFGLNVATYIVCELAGKPILNPLPIKNRRKVYEKLWRDLLTRESRILGEDVVKLPIDEDDVAFIFEDLHRGRSVIPPHEVPVRPVLVRWDIGAALSLQNCVVMDVGDSEKHLKGHGEGKAAAEVWGQETQDLVTKRVEEVSRYLQWNGD
ncbi:ubiquitin-protein ligase molybdopterin-converting factor [Cylindrobasidium torrendii FP15055 ss-10]|uniref:Ubiquitin-protein ligase molybdopterin-converting factor n=1 Tax=Cylindrobasidium torrendii FP15055 ss-10 TaxID=1314674 RepID=A0A0D7BLC8_9AGAR|nr:ubiquitin-protein ligase molybdopterin-converting factor [Cylindrobasidium torrendii FP15055 ss-10]